MDLSFPCVGDVDDGIFDLGLEDDQHAAGRQRCTTTTTKEALADQRSRSMVLSPDALDLEVMALATALDANEGNGSDDSGGDDFNGRASYPTIGSPFCDATLPPSPTAHQQSAVSGVSCGSKKKSSTWNRLENHLTLLTSRKLPTTQRGQEKLAKHSIERAKASPGGRKIASTKNASPRAADLEGWPPERLKLEQACVSAYRCTTDSSTDPLTCPSSMSDTRGSDNYRSTEPQRFRRQSLNRSLVDANTRSRWPVERAVSRDVVASSVRKEEEALAEADRAIACTHPRGPASGVVECVKRGWEDKRRVSFTVIDAAGHDRGSSGAPAASGGDTDEDEWGEKSAETGGAIEGEDDLLARASELHSSVAGQLRSVNELLKRKSYFYIDTSWSAKQLPCPPTAWKSRGGRTSDGGRGDHGGGGLDMVSNEACVDRGTTTYNAGYRPVASSPVNVVVKLKGRWLPAASKKKVGIFSIPGQKVHDPDWKCQDAAMVVAPLDRRESQTVFAIFDGHGINGRQASRKCMERLPKYLISASRSGDPASSLRRACNNLHRDLAKGAAGDCSRSGTTLCAAVLTGRKLTVANVGDSGCLRISRATSTGLVRSSVGGSDRVLVGGGEIGTRDAEMPDRDRGLGRRLIVERLSRDHKPECWSELQRIQAMGGTVFPLPTRQGDSGGGAGKASPQHEELGGARDRMLVRDFGAEVPRVWKAGASGPGLAMSRSIGDKIAHSVGVTHEPEITEFELDPHSDVMLVLASDGVWDVLSAEDIRKTTEQHVSDDTSAAAWCPQALSEEICRKALSEWATATSGGSDDITCVVVKTSPSTIPARRTSPVEALDTAETSSMAVSTTSSNATANPPPEVCASAASAARPS